MKGILLPDIKVFLLGVAAASGVTLFVSGQVYAAKASDVSGEVVKNVSVSGGAGVPTVQLELEETQKAESSTATTNVKGGANVDEPSSDGVSQPVDETGLQLDKKAAMKPEGASGKASVNLTEVSDESQEASMLQKEVPAAPTVAMSAAQSVKVMMEAVKDGSLSRMIALDETSAPGLARGVGRTVINLPLQPIITGNDAGVKDLAATLPTLPSRKHNLPPAESTGLLSQLTMNLAAVGPGITEVQRDVLWMVTVFEAAMGEAVLTILIGVVSLSFFAAWLRRSGFFGAARSDVSDRLNQFTASQRWGYDSEMWHSPFLMVSGRNMAC